MGTQIRKAGQRCQKSVSGRDLLKSCCCTFPSSWSGCTLHSRYEVRFEYHAL